MPMVSDDARQKRGWQIHFLRITLHQCGTGTDGNEQDNVCSISIPMLSEVQLSYGSVQRAKYPLCFFLELGLLVFVS